MSKETITQFMNLNRGNSIYSPGGINYNIIEVNGNEVFAIYKSDNGETISTKLSLDLIVEQKYKLEI
jgi:hypothetical protein